MDRAAGGSRDQGGLNEDDRDTLMRYARFRAAAEYVAAAFAGIPTVSRVALFGSVASSPGMEPGAPARDEVIFTSPKMSISRYGSMTPPDSSGCACCGAAP